MPMHVVLRNLNRTLQNQYHKVLGASPKKVINRKSIFDPLSQTLEGFSSKTVERIKRAESQNIKRVNKTRVNYNYQLSELVYKRIPVRNKISPVAC